MQAIITQSNSPDLFIHRPRLDAQLRMELG